MHSPLDHRPPKWADDFLQWTCKPEFIEEIQGDLHEAFYNRCQQKGPRYSNVLFVIDVFRSLSIKKTQSPFFGSKQSPTMFRNYLTIGYRNLRRNKVFSLVNIFGLALGIAACLLILQYVVFEMSYDKFHKDADRIYRVSNIVIQPGRETIHQAANHPGAGPTLKADFPEVEDYARILPQSIFMSSVAAWSYDDGTGNPKVFNEDRIYDADPSFLTLFSFPFLYGDPAKALVDPTSVVISETESRKFFGAENPVGKTLLLNGHRPFTVTGVFKDIPENSHVKFDMLVSFFMKQGWGGGWHDDWNWKWAEFYTYIKLKENADPKSLEAKFPAFAEKYTGERTRKMNDKEAFFMQPITDIHLRAPKMSKEQEVHGSQQTIYFLLIIAALILVIAWINYISLSTCKSIERAQEVGVRKVAGATKQQLITQFLWESAAINFLGITLALLLVALALPYFNQLAGKNMGTSFWQLALVRQPLLWVTLFLIFMLGSFGAGLYPAFVLSSFRIVTVLKGKFIGSQSGIVLRKILVGSQFAISASLIAGTLMVYQQVSFMRNQEMGYVKDQLLIVKAPLVGDSTFFNKLTAFKAEMKKRPAIQGISSTSEIPGKLISQVNYIRKIELGTEGDFLVSHFYIDTEFISTYGLEIVAGRNFLDTESLPRENDKTKPVHIMLNERAVELLGYKQPGDAIGQLINFGWGDPDWKGEIVGVVENHHQRSLREDYNPILFFPNAGFGGEYYTINMSLQNSQETISFIEDLYEKTFPGNQFEYFFLDDYFDRQYASDQQFGKVFGLFSALALFVAGLGLFALSTFMISQRIKEIAVRTVLGATIAGMVRLFSRDFVRLIIIANVIALPIVYFLVDRWLESFAFRIQIGWLMFVAPVVILLVISLVTVGVQTIKTGSGDPVKSLRAE